MPDKDPWVVLLGAFLSTRTKDEVTIEALNRLIALAPTVCALAESTTRKVAGAIYPVGFYRTKARRLIKLARILKARWRCRVPEQLKDLLKLPGVGRKVANIVLAQGFGVPAIAVDTHVHRTANRLGLVRTKEPSATEYELRRIVPVEYWREWNRLFVALGQRVCRPRNPQCGICPINRYCQKIGTRAGRAPHGRRAGNS